MRVPPLRAGRDRAALRDGARRAVGSVFLTKRPASAGDPVQFQTQWWLEQHGYYLPAVLTVPGSRGELANALRLDLVVDDQIVNCAEIIGAGPTRTMLMLRDPDPKLAEHADRTRHRRRQLPRRGAAGGGAAAGDPAHPDRKTAPADGLVLQEAEKTLPLNPRIERPLPEERLRVTGGTEDTPLIVQPHTISLLPSRHGAHRGTATRPETRAVAMSHVARRRKHMLAQELKPRRDAGDAAPVGCGDLNL